MIKDEDEHYIIDSNIISEVLKPNANFHVLEKLVEHVTDMAVTVMTLHELLYGMEKLDDGFKKTQLAKFINEEVCDDFPIVGYSEKAARIHAKIRAHMEKIGKPMPYGDSQIAAIALAEEMILVTGHIKHFEPIAEHFPLKLENWFDDKVVVTE